MQDGVVGRFLGIKAVRLAGESMHVRMDGSRFGHGRMGRQITLQNSKPAFFAPGFFSGLNDRPVGCRHGGKILCDGLTGDGQSIPMQDGKQFLHDCRYAAGLVKIRHIGGRRRIHFGNVGCTAA